MTKLPSTQDLARDWRGADAGCVSLTIWGVDDDPRGLEIHICGDDVGLSEVGLRRFAELMLHHVEACLVLAQREERL